MKVQEINHFRKFFPEKAINIQEQEKIKRELEQQVAEFFRAGGTVQEIPTGRSGREA